MPIMSMQFLRHRYEHGRTVLWPTWNVERLKRSALQCWMV